MRDNKVAILSIDDIRHITMINLYTEYFDDRNIAYEIICSNRYGDKDVKYGNAMVYTCAVSGNDASKARKLLDYFRFRKFAIDILNKNQYKYVVVWNERTIALFSGFLIRYGKFCVNIRDVGFPRIPFFFRSLDNAVQHSDFATWCAQRGAELLPRHDYIIVLNQNKKLVEGAKVKDGFADKKDKIRIGVVGYIRHIEESKELMKVFCNDERFILQFFGNGAEKLLDYASEICMKNIEIKGTFKPEETPMLLDQMDVLNAYVGDGKKRQEQALGSPIRYGYSTCLLKPAIVSPNTFLSERTRKLNIAYAVDSFDRFADRFYEWYYSLDFEKFREGCEEYNREFDKSIEDLYKVCDEKIYPVVKGKAYE